MAATDRLFGIENLSGSLQGDRLAGNGGANMLYGHRAADICSGAVGPTGSSSTTRSRAVARAGPNP